jgi:hypothetical protein
MRHLLRSADTYFEANSAIVAVNMGRKEAGKE